MAAARRKPATAIGYVRVSVDRDDKHSPDTQRRTIEDYCERAGVDLLDVVVERGKSAGRGKARPQFEAALQRIEAGEATRLVVYRLDRMTRSVGDFVNITDRLADCGADFVSVSEGFDTSTPVGRGMVQIAAVFAEMERETIRERLREHHRSMRQNGAGTQGVAVFGYRHDDDGRLVVCEDEAVRVRWMVDQLLSGATLRSVAKTLTDDGVPTPRKSRCEFWRYTAVRRIVTNPTIVAQRFDPDLDELVDAPWDPIVDRERFDRLQATISDPKRRSHDTDSSVRHLLSGIAVCAYCGAPMRSVQRKDTRGQRYRYRCEKSSTHPDACCGVSVFADELEAVVDAKVRELIGTSALPAVGPVDGGDDELARIDDKLADAARRWGRDELSDVEFHAVRADLIERRDRIESAQRATVSPTTVALMTATKVDDVWDSLDLDARRVVIRDLFDRVLVRKAERRGQPASERVCFET